MSTSEEALLYLTNSVPTSVWLITPEIIGVFLLIALVLLETIDKNKRLYVITPILTLIGLAASSVVEWYIRGDANETSVFGGTAVFSPFTFRVDLLLNLSLGLTAVWSWITFKSRRAALGEYYMMAISLWLGARVMTSASHFLTAYLGLALTSISAYVLSAYFKDSKASAEATLKYMLYGAFSTGVTLYGVSLLYGLTGELYFSPALTQTLTAAPINASIFALLLITVGIAYKISAAPFHFWTPDVYQAAPAPIAAFFSVAPKIGGFALLYHLNQTFQPIEKWPTLLAFISILSMTAGNLAALKQDNFRRLMAFSGVAHAGYMLALLATGEKTSGALLFYLFIYSVTNYGAFLLGQIYADNTGNENISGWKGLSSVAPARFVAFVIFMLSLTGLPPTAGFIAKLYTFIPIWEKYQSDPKKIWLVLLTWALINTAISLIYYLKPIVILLQKNINEAKIFIFKSPLLLSILFILTALTLLLGIIGFDVVFNWLNS